MDNLPHQTKVSRKTRRIIRALANAGRKMTRDELARAIGQARLYDHDLKLIARLVNDLILIEHRRRRMHVLFDRNPLAEFDYEQAFQDARTRQAYRWGKMGYVYEYEINPLYAGYTGRP